MKRFIQKACIYIVLLIVLAIGLDWIITRGLQQVDHFIYEPWTYIREGNHTHDVLIIGNSRAQGHIHPIILDSICECNSYNLGIEAYHMNMHILKCHYYLKYNHKPKLIIYQIDLATIHNHPIKRGSNSEQFLPLFYNPFWRDKLEYLGYNKVDLYCPLYRYFGYHTAIRYGMLEGLNIKHIVMSPAEKGFKGWDELMAASITQDEIAKINQSNRFTTNTDDLKQFEVFIQECKDNDVAICLVYSPMYTAVQEGLIDRYVFENYLNEVSTKYDVPYIDYTKDVELCSNPMYFSSPGHLNLLGAEVFTTKLAHDIDSLGLLKK